MSRFFVLCFVFLIAESCSSPKENPELAPNVVVIFTDDMGYGDLECYGNPNIATPNINQLAREGVRFTSFYAAASVCSPSRAALLTGRYPIRNVPSNFGPTSTDGLPLEEVTLASILKSNGYNTYAVGKWHLGHENAYLPTNRGFDAFYGLPYSNDMILPWCPWLTPNDRLFLYEDNQPKNEIGFDQENLTVDYTQKAINYIAQNKDQPFFMYLAHSMPHLPISASEPFLGKSKGGLYGDVIETIDWSVGEIIKTLEDLGLRDNTLIVFTSDNGPWNNLPERMVQKGVAPWHTGTSGLLRGSKNTSYEGGFRVPAVISFPGKFKQNVINRQSYNTMDVFSTIVALTGSKLPQDKIIDGRSMMPVLTENEQLSEAPFYYCRGMKLEALRFGHWKLRLTPDDGLQLFDLDNDPGESYNTAGDNPEKVEELMQKMIMFSTENNLKLNNNGS